MGQKVNPVSFRLAVTKNWQSKWITDRRTFGEQLQADIKLRKAVMKKLGTNAGVSKVEIERSPNQIILTIHTSRPGVIIGRGGSGVEDLRKAIASHSEAPIKVNIMEIRKPEMDAQLVAENVANQLEKRIAFRRALKGTVEASMRAGAKGVKIAIAGRLGGAEMSRREAASQGSIPLHTLRADIDFAKAIAKTTYGTIGVKVWIYKGEMKEDTGKTPLMEVA